MEEIAAKAGEGAVDGSCVRLPRKVVVISLSVLRAMVHVRKHSPVEGIVDHSVKVVGVEPSPDPLNVATARSDGW